MTDNGSRDAEREAHDRGRGKNRALVLLALAVGGFAIGTTEFATMSLLPDFARGLHVDAPTAGHAISAYALGVVVGAPVIAMAAAKIARRTLLLMLMALFALGNALSAFTPSFPLLLLFRFVSGLPHGAYFGIASLVAAALVDESRRTWAVSRVFLGLTAATIVGVPAANWIGQTVGWRWGFGAVALLGLLALTSILIAVPYVPPDPTDSPAREWSALRRPQIWLTLAIGAIGSGGLFSVFTYLSSTLTAVTHVSPETIPLYLCIFGVGITAGNLVVPLAADRWPMPTTAGLLAWMVVAAGMYPLAAGNSWTMGADVFAVGAGGALATVLQTRLMAVAGEAQALAAALNHSAFNTANALGPYLGGLTIGAGLGWTSTGLVGVALSLAGLAIWWWSFRSDAATGQPA